MIGIVVQLTLSWLIIWWFDKGNLSVLGWQPTVVRLRHFLLFSLVTSACCASGFGLRIYAGQEIWERNPALTMNQTLSAIGWNIKSVLFEELIFRGALFYILWKKLGATKAMIISSTAFGIYHWFSQELWGNTTQMVIVFLLTGIMGMVYAYGYVKTKSLYVPCAIHFGWNITQGFVFSHGSIGNGVFMPALEQPHAVTLSYLTYGIITFSPLLSSWLFNYLLLSRSNDAK